MFVPRVLPSGKHLGQWWADGKYLGARPRLVRDNPRTAYPTSILFYCPKCGEAWGRMMIEGQNTYAFARPCTKCPPVGYDVPGSMWIDWDRDQQDSMPEGVLKRELELHIRDYDLGGSLIWKTTPSSCGE